MVLALKFRLMWRVSDNRSEEKQKSVKQFDYQFRKIMVKLKKKNIIDI